MSPSERGVGRRRRRPVALAAAVALAAVAAAAALAAAVALGVAVALAAVGVTNDEPSALEAAGQCRKRDPMRSRLYPQEMAMKVPPRLMGIAFGGAALGVFVIFVVVGAAKGCGGARIEALETRVAKLEAKGGSHENVFGDAGVVELGARSGGDRHASCAVAKVAAYDAWQEATITAKKSAAPAETQCAAMWSEKRKQSCYYAATAALRATQSARDAVMKGGAAARDAAKAVKDDPKNEGIAKARAASEAAVTACPADDTSADLR